MEATRSAVAVWQGDLLSGTGEVNSETSTHLRGLPVSWAARTEDPQGRTSPEELLAAAHSACFCMALSADLARAGHRAERIEARADVTFAKADNGWSVARSHITVSARVPGIDADGFRQAAEGAKDGCPISRALKGNVELSVSATLES
ncbi:MAG TPA: OsmC family peroxiredoxin [Candidatus Limnocylindria bacterium]|nr:OsmC family peroxiredoxin [Candidatus Limnocylindria bacterium]